MADCRDDAWAARSRIEASGPYRYERHVWNQNFRRQECGVIDPGRAEHEYPCSDRAYGQYEVIVIDSKVWENDGLGWFPSGERLNSFSLPELFARFKEEASCLGVVTEDGRTFEKYLFASKEGKASIARLFVDPSSGLPVRMEWDGSVNSVTTYTYDPALRIEIPAVDLEQRRATSLARFDAAVSASDPACRARFFETVERGRKASFRFSRQGFMSHDGGTMGAFSPPFSFRFHHLDLSQHYPPRDATYIADDPWAGPNGYDETKVYADLKYLRWELMPLPDEVGGTRCMGKDLVEGHEYDVIDYDIYGDDHSAKRLIQTRRMQIDPISRLPIRIQIQRPDWHDPSQQRFIDIQTRHYEPFVVTR